MPPSTIAPKAATMIAPPSWRAKLSAPVAVPSWCGSTVFCTIVVVTGYITPRPAPPTVSSTQTSSSDSPRGLRREQPRSMTMPSTSPPSGTRL